MKKIISVLLFAAFILCAVSCTGTPDGPVTGADTKPAQTAAEATGAQTAAQSETPTEAQSETPTEAQSETVTEALTEKATEAPTEKVTEQVTEKETELIPGDFESVLIKETYHGSDGNILSVYEYENGFRMKDTYYYGDNGALMSSIEYIYDGEGKLMGTVTYDEHGSVSESSEVSYETMQELGDITSYITTTKTYNRDHITTGIMAESVSYDKNGVLLYGSTMDTYLTYDPEHGTYQEDTAYGTAYEYEYDKDGLLARSTVTSLGMKTITTYSYDYEGTLIRMDITDEGIGIKPVYWIFDYTDGGLLMKITIYEENGDIRNCTLYDYNEYYQVIKETIYDETNAVIGYTEYEYKLTDVGGGVG